MQTYTETHPWLTFSLNLQRAPHDLWLMLGECRALVQQIAQLPLRPAVAMNLHNLYLAKGIMATTAIEGNTLSEAEILQRIDGKLKLPQSREYLGVEVDNVHAGFNAIIGMLKDGPISITPELINTFNLMVLRGLQLEEGVKAGEVRHYSVGVANYRGAPAMDCEFLVDKLVNWLNSKEFCIDDNMNPVMAILKSIISHIYIAWIHPFGDGNGRTARMLELAILLDAGFPTPAVHLLSNHYNKTRTEYYQQLERTSKSGGNIMPFILYAVRGLLDGLNEQLNSINFQVLWDAWQNYIYEAFREKSNVANHRRKRLALAMSRKPDGIHVSEVPELTPSTARDYAGKTLKTATRDLNVLKSMGLVIRKSTGEYVANRGRMMAFMPARAETLRSGELPGMAQLYIDSAPPTEKKSTPSRGGRAASPRAKT